MVAFRVADFKHRCFFVCCLWSVEKGALQRFPFQGFSFRRTRLPVGDLFQWTSIRGFIPSLRLPLSQRLFCCALTIWHYYVLSLHHVFS